MNYIFSFVPALFTDEVNDGSTTGGGGGSGAYGSSSSAIHAEDNRPIEATLYYFAGRGRADQLR